MKTFSAQMGSMNGSGQVIWDLENHKQSGEQSSRDPDLRINLKMGKSNPAFLRDF